MRARPFAPFLRASVLLLACLAPACGDSDDDPAPTAAAGDKTVTQTVGPEGGTILVEGAVVTFPKGALAAPTEIKISATDDAPPDGFVALSKIFRCEPSGTSFAEGVTMKMPFTDDGQPSSMFWSSGASPEFKDLGGEPSAGTMTATVKHFSAGFVGRKK